MEEFREKFLEEAAELFETLENALLDLENDIDYDENVNAVFRVVHTLKGTGSMFGYNRLSEFAHDLESVYALVREKKLDVTRELIDNTFNSISILKEFLKQENEENEEVLEARDGLLMKFKNLTAETTKEEIVVATTKDFKRSKQEKNMASWWVHFVPDKNIMKDGSNPLYMIEEVSELGKSKVWLYTTNIPVLEELVPEDCYVSWDVIISTGVNKEEIEDVFLFVQDESELVIEKLADVDVFDMDETVRNKIENLQEFDVDLIRNLMDDTVSNYPQKKSSGPINQEEPVINSLEKEKQKEEKSIERTSTLLQTIRVPSVKLDRLMDLVSEVITTQARLEHYSETHPDVNLENITESYQKLSRQLRENVLDMRLIPVNSILSRYKKLIRDLTANLDKKVNFITKGTDTELDKSIIEKLTDPVTHIIRNSIDHGIETVGERVGKGKPEEGTITFEAFYESSNIIIKISDNGRGIDPAKLKQKALEKGIEVSAEASEKELLNLIFHPGFSTAEKVTDISGRGVGMDVVKRNIESLRGVVEIDSVVEKGTAVKIILPLTLSIIDGLLIHINQNRYLIQMDEISHIYEVSEDELRDNFDHILVKEGRQVPFINLSEIFSENGEEYVVPSSMIVLFHEDIKVGVLVNKIEGKYQAVIKPLNNRIQTMEVFSGATILGDGTIALVIDTNKLIKKLYS
jgi:two-component system chemotaxis sensor kinase CheA